jgi:Cu/Ag efflux pump CusA
MPGQDVIDAALKRVPPGEFKSIGDLRNMMIGTSPNGTPLYLRDVVDVAASVIEKLRAAWGK